MENIERTQFVVLTGHLDEQPLPDLIRRLRVQRKSGRLQVEYPDDPGSFFFEDGQLVDAHLGSLRGVEAIYAALFLKGASFNFNPLVRPPERNIAKQEQQFIRDLIEAPRREGLAEIKAARAETDTPAAATPALPQNAALQLAPAAELVAPLEERLTAVEEAIISTSHRFSRERMIYAVIIGFLTGLCLVATMNFLFDPFGSEPAPPAAATRGAGPESSSVKAGGEAARASSGAEVSREQEGAGRERGGASLESASEPKAETPADEPQPPVPSTAAVIGTRRAEGVSAPRGGYVVQVLVEVKGGQVTDARVWNPRPGAGTYEAVALKMARERRYPEGFTGSERLKIRVQP